MKKFHFFGSDKREVTAKKFLFSVYKGRLDKLLSGMT